MAAGITRANANIMISTRHTSVVAHDRPCESTRTIGKNDYKVKHCGMHVLGLYRCFLALVILRASAVVGQTPPGLVDARTCRVTASAVQSLHTADGRPAYVEAPVGYGDERTFTVTGAPAWEWYSKTSVMPLQPTDSASVSASVRTYVQLVLRHVLRSGFRVDRSATVTGIPNMFGERAVYRPALVPFRARTTALVWVERDEDLHSESLWFAPAAGGHLAARRLWSGSQLYWDGVAASYSAKADVAMFVVSYSKGGVGSGLLFVRISNVGVSVKETPLNGMPDHATVASMDTLGERWLVIYSASDVQSTVSNGSHLFSGIFRVDSGLTGGKRIQWSGLDHASHPLLSSTVATGELLLTWTLSARSSPVADTLKAWTSRDRGESWHQTSEIATPGGVALLMGALVDGVPVYATFVPGRADTTLAVFAYSSGSFQPVALPSATAASTPQWITLGTKAALLWGATRADVQGGDSPVTQLSRFSARCSR